MNDNNMRFYYPHGVEKPLQCPPLQADKKVDIAIMGAGFTGLASAILLAKSGYRVAIVEEKTIGAGASGRNGGHLCTGFTKDMAEVEKMIGLDRAKALWELVGLAPKLVENHIKDYKIDCELQWGYLHVAARRHHLKSLHEMQEEWRRYGYKAHEFLDKAALEVRLDTKAYFGGVREGGAGHLHPFKYVQGLAKAAIKEGVEIYEDSEVTRIQSGKNGYLQIKNGAKLYGDFMLVAGNAYHDLDLPETRPFLLSVGSYIMATAPLGHEAAKALIKGNEAVADSNIVLDYYRIGQDTRLIFGGRATYSGREPNNLQEFIHKRMRRVFPQLSKVSVDYAWGGKIGLTLYRYPHIGRIGDNVYFAQGYCGHGVALSHAIAQTIAQVIQAQSGYFDLFSTFKPPAFPGGALRQSLLSLGMLYYRLRDYWG